MNRAWIELDKEALRHNIDEYRRILPDTTRLMAVVKADGYGHGAVQVSRELVKYGIDFLAVASVEEAVVLRREGINNVKILILGYTDPAFFDTLSSYDLIQTIPGKDYGLLLREYCERTHRRIKAHIAIDSGMHRIGYFREELDDIIDIYRDSTLKVCGIFTHMCVANEDKPESVEYTNMQIDYFNSVVKALRDAGVNPGDVHQLSSFASINYKDNACDYARIGVLMYGNKTEEADYISEETDFRPVLSLKAHVASVRWIEPGMTVSYGRWFTAERPTRIATLTIGYADGIPRSLSNGKLKVIVNGKYAYGTGRICMDQLMIDVTDIEDVKMGDVVTFIGKDGELEIRAEEMAEAAGTITHELFSRLGHRLENIGFNKDN